MHHSWDGPLSLPATDAVGHYSLIGVLRPLAPVTVSVVIDRPLVMSSLMYVDTTHAHGVGVLSWCCLVCYSMIHTLLPHTTTTMVLLYAIHSLHYR